jgi:uncharacterized protein YkwD
MNALALTLLLTAPSAEDDLTRAMTEVLGRANRMHAEAYFSRCAGVCEGALLTLRGRVKDAKLKRRIEIGLTAADLEPTPQRQAGRLVKLLAEVCKELGVEAPAPAVVVKKPAAKEEGLSEDEQELLELTNAQRKKEGLAPLKANPKLFAAARAHSANMAKADRLDHELDDTPAERVKAAGYVFRTMGENIAAGQRTAEEAISSWMRSEGHRGNLLGGEYEEVGLAVAATKDGKRYWTQVFAAPFRR